MLSYPCQSCVSSPLRRILGAPTGTCASLWVCVGLWVGGVHAIALCLYVCTRFRVGDV